MQQHPSSSDSRQSYLPISCFIVKVASRCNLNCAYCYMYNLADHSYLRQPTVMSREVVDATIARIEEHVVRHGLERINIVFHGGEPLLAGEPFFRYFVEAAKKSLSKSVTPCFQMQTNATLLTSKWLEVLTELEIDFGISLDGTAEAHDANRVDHQGQGSYSRVIDAIKLIMSDDRFREHLARPVLTVVNVESDPVEVYDHLRSLGFSGADLHLPDGTHDNPPPGLVAGKSDTAYGDWLIAMFDEWFDRQDKSFGIRLFENIIGLLFGASMSTDTIGGRKSNCAVIETDGGIEPMDALKACGEDFTKVGLNVLNNSIDEIYEIPLFKNYLGGLEELCDTCKQCPVESVCGGGYIPHRFSSERGFDNPSIYCRDLIKIISHVQERTLSTLPEAMRNKLRLATLADVQAAQCEA